MKLNVTAPVILLLLSTPVLHSQQAARHCSSRVVLGSSECTLIAWSWMQQPSPIVPAPSSVPTNAPSEDPAAETRANSPAQVSFVSVAGVVYKERSNYVLNAGENVIYQFDNQDKAEPYLDKRVRIFGWLDASTKTLHIDRIELLS